VDFLVELDVQAPGSPAKRWIALAEGLEKLLGRHVDLVNPRYIRNPYFSNPSTAAEPSSMTDKTPKSLADAVDAIESAQFHGRLLAC
jgi:hypothetical protein